MPSRNIIKLDLADTYYHVYARGNSKQAIFLDAEDFTFFSGLFARYLSRAQTKDKLGVAYPHYSPSIDLVCYCLMGNHFHLLLYQKEQGAMTALMRSLLTSYSRYFNKKYKRSGALFESRYKASRIDTDGYLQHVSRYIHLNPRYWRRYPHSSLGAYLDSKKSPEWLHSGDIMSLFHSPNAYRVFLADHEDYKQMLEELKYELADV